MSRLKLNSTMPQDYVIPGEPLYLQDYFKQRNPERLKKIKKLHDDGKYLDFEEVTMPSMTAQKITARTLKQIIDDDYIDDYNRIFAITYIDGNIYETQMHRDAINDYLASKNIQLNDGSDYRPSNDTTTSLVDDNNLPLAFAHLAVDDEGEPTIFLETDTINNVDLDTVIQALKTKYDYPICLFQNHSTAKVVKVASRLLQVNKFNNSLSLLKRL